MFNANKILIVHVLNMVELKKFSLTSYFYGKILSIKYKVIYIYALVIFHTNNFRLVI